MPENAVEYINEVSNDPAAVGIDQLLTAEAVQGKIPASPTIVEFDDSDIIAGSGILVVPYVSNESVVFYSMKDENDESILVPATFDDAGQFASFDFTSLENTADAPEIYINGTWKVAVWTANGPIVGVPGETIGTGSSETGRVRLEPIAGDIDFKVATSHTIFTVEADTLFSPEELEIMLLDAVGVTGQVEISLEVVSGDTIVTSQAIPIDTQYERYAIDISASNVLPAGSVIQITITTAGVASGNMVGRAYLFGYIDEV